MYIVCADGLDLSIWPATLISFTVAFMFRYTAMLRGWEEPDLVDTRGHVVGEWSAPRIQDRLGVPALPPLMLVDQPRPEAP